jgi:hypothetical protein
VDVPDRGSSDGDVTPSAQTLSRWGGQYSANLVLALPFGIVAVIEILVMRGPERIAVVAGTAVLVAFMYAMYRRLIHKRPGALWSGFGDLKLRDLQAAGLADSIKTKSKMRFNFWTQGGGDLGGRLEVRQEGLRMTLGMLSRLAGVRGFVVLPWDRIKHIEVGHIPGTVDRGKTGGITIELQTGNRLDGQFVGSRDDLIRALPKLPVEQPDEG